jgi:hypothetical protein
VLDPNCSVFPAGEISMAIWRSPSPTAAPVEYTTEQTDLRAAYNRGRIDERRARRHHPFIALAVVVLALVGAWLLFLAAKEGSFSSGGEAADRNLSTVSQEARPALRDTGEAIKDAGATLKDKSQDVVQRDGEPSQPVR